MADIYNSQLDAFVLYHKIHPIHSPSSQALPALGHAISGSCGAATSNLETYPLSLIITRLQIQRQLRNSSTSTLPNDDVEYTSIVDAAQKIYEREGRTGFYSGLGQDTGKTIADSFLFFLAYTFLRETRLKTQLGKNAKYLPVLDELGVGFLAGAFAKGLTTPLANIVTRMQIRAMQSAPSSSTCPQLESDTQQEKIPKAAKTSSMRIIAHQIRRDKGLAGFWSGYFASLVLTLNPSITFFLYETLKRLLRRARRDGGTSVSIELGPRAIFLLAAFSKAIASSVTYPFSLAKARAQAGSKVMDDTNDDDIKADMEEVSGGKVQGGRGTRKAAQTTVFGTILSVARKEGAGALYEGLGGEVLKGFFSHGFTMIVKEALHEVVIRVYFLLLGAVKRRGNLGQLVGKG